MIVLWSADRELYLHPQRFGFFAKSKPARPLGNHGGIQHLQTSQELSQGRGLPRRRETLTWPPTRFMMKDQGLFALRLPTESCSTTSHERQKQVVFL